MKDNRLLASIALFRELYDKEKDIYDVLSDFIRAAIAFSSSWSFSSTECAGFLRESFGFEVPDAVVKTCLRNRLAPRGEVTVAAGAYTVDGGLDKQQTIIGAYEASKNEYREITNQLIEHVAARSPVALSDAEKDTLISDFNDYLLKSLGPSGNLSIISHFILSNQGDATFRAKLNRVEEGLVLYTGIRYSPDLGSLGSWPSDLTLFLDTEILFSAAGLNGELYKKLFDDFHGLVREVNTGGRKGGKIELRYFREAAEELSRFFYAAEEIVQRNKQADPSKTAMISIVNGCRNRSDVAEKKANVLDLLKRLRIEAEKPIDYYADRRYNIESEEVIGKLKERLNRGAEGEKFANILKLFTKVNVIRRGESRVGLDRVRAILVTANSLTRQVAFASEVFPGGGAIPFATDIEFLTERLWFKLNKGFGRERALPTSFDVIERSRIVLSAQVGSRISDEYKELNSRYDSGELTKQRAGLLMAQLRTKAKKPEEMDRDSIDEAMAFLDHDFIEAALREKALLEQKSQEGDLAKAKADQLRRQLQEMRVAPIRKRICLKYCLALMALGAIPVGTAAAFTATFWAPSDTPLATALGLLAVASLVAGLLWKRPVIAWLRRRLTRKYRDTLRQQGAWRKRDV